MRLLTILVLAFVVIALFGQGKVGALVAEREVGDSKDTAEENGNMSSQQSEELGATKDNERPARLLAKRASRIAGAS